MLSLVSLFGNWLTDFGPRLVVGLCFFPCGLQMGYTLSSFALEKTTAFNYGPIILGVSSAFLTSIIFYLTKHFKNKIIFCHIEVLLSATVINILASAFYFTDKLDYVGAFLAFMSYGITYISATSYLNMITAKSNRSIFLSLCFVWYLIGSSTAVTLIYNSYHKNLNDFYQNNTTNDSKTTVTPPTNEILPLNITNGIYKNLGGVYLGVSIIIGILLIIIKIFHFLGNLDYKTSCDNDIHVANSNGTIFDSRDEVIKRVQFFYVTKNKQWLISFILLFCDAIHFSLFIYFICWCTFNSAIQLTTTNSNLHLLLWTVFFGSTFTIIFLIFLSIKVIFVTSSIAQIIFVFLAMIFYDENGGIKLIPIWILFILYGINFSNLKVSILETSNFKYIEFLTFISLLGQLSSLCVINESFISNLKSSSIFYNNGQGTLIAHGLSFATITALITIIIIIQLPRTFKISLFDLQYCLIGMIFKKHQIEQLNQRWLKDGTIPTITRNVET